MTDQTTTLDPRTPVIVAVGQLEQRASDPAAAAEPTTLLAEAARLAAADSGSDRLLAAIDTMAVVRIFSNRYSDPAAMVAAELGITPRRTIETDEGGNYPQALANRAAREVLAGQSDVWLIGGAEAWRSRTAARAAGHWSTQDPDLQPTERITNHEKLIHDHELARRVFLPIEVYPLFENAHRASQGWTIDEHRDRLAQLWSGFSEVAATNPHAWIRRAYTPAEVREATPDNRMVGFPYTKVMNANNAVEQAAAFVMCSVEKARSLGISSDRWVFPWSGTDAHEHWFVSNRWDLAEAPAIRLAGGTALELAGVGIDDLAHVDVYSCFPSAVQIAAKELGLGTDRQLTVTGGLSFAGGPWNNYVSHSIATMTDVLRADAGSVGMITGNGGYLSKHAFGVYSATPPARSFQHADRQPDVDALPSRELAEAVTDGDGPVTVETSTVMFDRESQPERAIVAVLLADGRRAWGGSTDPEVMTTFTSVETHGRTGHIDAEGEFRFV